MSLSALASVNHDFLILLELVELNRDDSLRLQFRLDFLFRIVISVMNPVKQNSLALSPRWTVDTTGIFTKDFSIKQRGFLVTSTSRAPDLSFLTDFGAPTIRSIPFWIGHGDILVRGFGCESDSSASRVMKRGQVSKGESFSSSFEESS